MILKSQKFYNQKITVDNKTNIGCYRPTIHIRWLTGGASDLRIVDAYRRYAVRFPSRSLPCKNMDYMDYGVKA